MQNSPGTAPLVPPSRHFRLFVSWSGTISLQIASVLQQWIPDVLDQVDPFISIEDIDKGARWGDEVARALETCSYGIICLTPSNTRAEWIHFEAGALSKHIDRSLVASILFGIPSVNDIPGTLRQFQLTRYQNDDMRRMMRTINSRTAQPLEDSRFERRFDTYWPQLQERMAPLLERITEEAVQTESHVSADPAINELLDLARSLKIAIDRATGDPFFTFRGNTRLEPLRYGDYRQLALGLAMLKELAEIERGYHMPQEAILRTLLMLRDPLEVILARGYAPRIHSLYFDDEHGPLRMKYTEDDVTLVQTVEEALEQVEQLNQEQAAPNPYPPLPSLYANPIEPTEE